MEVIDKLGRKVARNGALEDGDTLRVKMNLMDAMPLNPALVDAVAHAEAQRRIEAFDKSDVGHRPGSLIFDQSMSLDLRKKRDAAMCDAWKNPPSVTTSTATALEQIAVVGASAPVEQLQAARDQAIYNRDKRLEAAWQK